MRSSTTTTTTTVFNSSSYSSSSLLFIFVSCYSFLLLSHSVVVDSFSLSYEGEALLSLLNSFSSDSVPDSIKLSWKNSSSSTPCHWSGVRCNTEKTHVVSLDLNGYEITGQLGPEIGQLRYLTSLDLSVNYFNGSIPTELWNCSHLQRLYLSGNEFTGELPEAVGNLQQLRLFSIFGNHLRGEIPTELWNCSHLQLLDLSYNNFTGVLPDVVSNLHQLNSFVIYDNQFSGRILESLFKISGLEYVDLSVNHFNGSIPVEMTELHHLTYISLYNNQFSGLIPEALGINSTSLEEVDLSNNTFSGEIPPNLCFGKQLGSLNLGLNKLEGSIPSWYTENCYTLESLVLKENNLNGSLPHFEKNYSSLSVLDISGNSIHGKIPPSICYPSYLQNIDLSDNLMNGTLPHCLGDLEGSMNLRSNDFTGTIPPNFTSDRLRMLDLNGNRFEGKIPRIHSPRLKYLDLGNNQLEDTFPFFLFLGKMSSPLQILVLRSNKLYGSLKQRLHNSSSSSSNSTSFNKLKVLDISSNYFTGDLPLEFYLGFEAMKHIDHVHNEDIYYLRISTVVIYKGKETRLNRTFMEEFRAIDMSNNTFQGTIPESIGKLLNLTMLNLSNNNFNGRIPSSLGNLAQLESLDLSYNRLSREIPRRLTDMHSLAVLNLSYNNLTGRIPDGGQFSTFTNDSFSGNSGLCGLQISRKCGNKKNRPDPIKEKQSYEDSDNPWKFGWEPVVIGYGCGVLIGLVVQYFLFTKAFLYKWLILDILIWAQRF